MILEDILTVAESTGVYTVMCEGIQKKYADFSKGNQTEKIKALVSMSGIKPEFSETSVQEIQEVFAERMNDCYFEARSIEEMFELTNIGERLSDAFIQELYMNLAKRSDFNTLKRFVELTGRPIAEDVVQDVYRDFFRLGHFGGDLDTCCSQKVERLQEISGIDPDLSEEFVQEMYVFFAREKSFDKLKRLRLMTDITPAFSADFVQEMFANYIKQDSPWSLCDLRELSGFNPDEKPIQEKYVELIEKDDLDDLERWRKASGIKPENTLIQEKYADFFEVLMNHHSRESWTNKRSDVTKSLKKIRRLKNTSGVDPDETLVQPFYDKFLQSDEGYYFRAKTVAVLDAIQQTSGIKIHPSPEVLKKAYTDLAYQGAFDAFDLLEEVTSLPWDFSEAEVQKVYSHYLDFRSLNHVPGLYERTGIELQQPTTVIQKYCESYIERRSFDSARALSDLTGVQPSETFIQDLYTSLIRDESNLSRARELRRTVDIEPKPSEDVVQKKYAYSAKHGGHKYFVQLHELTGIKPSEDAHKAFIEWVSE